MLGHHVSFSVRDTSKGSNTLLILQEVRRDKTFVKVTWKELPQENLDLHPQGDRGVGVGGTEDYI